MALPMMHLLTAYDFAQDKPELKMCPEYYLGAVSPDAIHIRDGNDKSRKNVFHLNNWRTPDPDAVLEYWRTNRAPFDIGYGVHVLLDGNWATAFRRDFPDMLLQGGKPNAEIYYNDTFTNDYQLYHESSLTPFFIEMLKTAVPPKTHPLLTAEEIGAWRDWTLEFYIVKEPSGRPVRFITMDYAKRFMEQCPRIYAEIYQQIRKDEDA